MYMHCIKKHPEGYSKNHCFETAKKKKGKKILKSLSKQKDLQRKRKRLNKERQSKKLSKKCLVDIRIKMYHWIPYNSENESTIAI